VLPDELVLFEFELDEGFITVGWVVFVVVGFVVLPDIVFVLLPIVGLVTEGFIVFIPPSSLISLISLISLVVWDIIVGDGLEVCFVRLGVGVVDGPWVGLIPTPDKEDLFSRRLLY